MKDVTFAFSDIDAELTQAGYSNTTALLVLSFGRLA
jgi:hypothetical protein